MNKTNANGKQGNQDTTAKDSIFSKIFKKMVGLLGAKTPDVPVTAPKAVESQAKAPAKPQVPTKPQAMATSPEVAAGHSRSAKQKHVGGVWKGKPTYRPVARGTTFLVDTGNLIGSIGPEHAAARLASMRQAMKAAGYSVVFFWEHRAYCWTKAQQATEAEKRALMDFVKGKDVSLVDHESDLAILQAAKATPNSVCLTRDHYRDYAETYPQIVGSLRHRSFSVAKIAGVMVLSVFGLKDAIKLQDVEARSPKPVVSAAAPKPQPVKVVPMAAPAVGQDVDDPMVWTETPPRTFGPNRRAGLYGCVDARLAAGDGDTALKLLGKIARKDPAAYEEMSRIYNEGDGLPPDARLAKRYARLAKKGQKVARQLARRQKRQVANCEIGLDRANIHGIDALFLQRNLEHCAMRKADRRRVRFGTRKSRKHGSEFAA